MVSKELKKQLEKVNSKIDELNEEINNLESKKSNVNSLLLMIFIPFFFWIVSGFNIQGKQIIWACIFILLIWFVYYLLFYIIRTYIRTFKNVKAKFTKYINLKEKVRDDIHSAIDELTPHFSKRAQTSTLMTVIMIVALLIITLYPNFNSDISFNLFNDNSAIFIIIFIFLIVKLVIISQPNRSLKYFLHTEKMVETSFRDEKIRKIASNKKVQYAGVLIYAIIGSIPTVFCIISMLYFIFKYQQFFDLPSNIFLVIIVVQVIAISLMQRYSNIKAQLSIGYEMKIGLINLKKQIEKGKIRSKKKINESLDHILYTKFQI